MPARRRPGDGGDLPCAVGAPGCPPAVGIPAPGDGTTSTTTSTGTQLETLAYTGGGTVDYRLGLLAVLLLASGAILLAPRRKKA